MTSQPIDTPVQPMRDSDLTAVLDNYLTALRRGEHPSKETLLRDHPHLAAELSGCLQTLDMLQACANFDVDVSDGDRDSVTQRSLGDYHLLREVGRGGMGVVYEAEQISLSRRVALKILPFAAVLDPRHLQRFKNEAMAAAHLDHPNIVEVYGIGCERSIHFYAMRFIEGVTLADVVEAKRRSLAGNVEERNPQVTSNSNDEAQTEVFSNSSDASLSTPHAALAAETSPVLQAALSTVNSITPKERFRRIAEIGIQAAEALDHAHQMGIVHRDIKPSNLMLDERGKLWVTDFGLARNQGDASMTMTGDLVGTLRYMSPEQALAKRITVDHRTDIYSLGVTLYELLTLRPAFPSNDRQETLRQIAFEEPTAPRKLDKSIPEELKTIILKAMEKNPEDRYATARDVADDLQRWVEHKPIVARAPGIGRRAMKLTRRYAGIVTTASVALCILVIVLACSLLLLNTAFQKEAQQRQLAEFEANLGQEVLTNALEVIDRTILTLGVRELKRYPETQELQFRLVTDALSVCEKMLRDAGDVGAAVRVLNMTQYLARVERQRGNAEVAAALEERARAVVTELSEQSTRDPALAATLVDEITEGLALSDVAKHQSITADLLFQLLPQFRRIPQNSENFYLEALAAEGVSRSAELSNKNKLKLLADLVERGQVHEAGLLDQYLVPVAFSTLYQAMARLYEEDAENAMAAVAWGHAAEYQERFFRHSKQPGYGTVAARCLLEQAEVALPEDREELFAKALELAAPREREQAIATGQLAAVLLRQNKLQEAEKLATRSVEIWRLLLKESSGLDIQTWFPSNPTISLSYETLGEVLELKGERKEVASLFEEEITMWRKFTESVDPPDQVCVRELARAQFAYGAFEIVAGNRKEARPPYQSALNDTRQSLLQVSRYPRGLPALHRLLAYQLLMSPAVRWRDHQSAFAHLVEARSTSDNKEGVEYIEALHSLRTGNSAAAIETLRSHKPSMALALAYALVPDEDAAINVVSKVHVETEHIYSGRGGLREYEVQLRELAKILAIDVREMKLATPFLERWIRRPLPGKTD